MEIQETLLKEWEDFKKTNDAALEECQKKGHVDPLVEEQLKKANDVVHELSTRLEKAETKINRPSFGAGKSEEDEAKEKHEEQFVKWIRKGRSQEDSLKEIEQKTINRTTGSDGEFAVPEQIDRTILSLMQDLSPMRQLASVISVSTPDYKKLVSLHGTTTGWVDEDDARSATTTPSLAQVAPTMGEVYAHLAATQQALDDIFFNVPNWLATEAATQFAIAEGTAFVSGDGSKKPTGFLNDATAATADSARAFGTLEHVATGVDADFAASDKGDKLIDVTQTLKADLRGAAVWLTNKALLGEIRQFKGSDNNYLWQPNLAAGQPSTLLGYPVREDENMPAKASDSLSLAFGDFKRGYLIVDRIGIRSLRDPYTAKPTVIFYTTKRVGGDVIDSEAIKILKFGVS